MMKTTRRIRDRRRLLVDIKFQRHYILSLALVSVMAFNALLAWLLVFHDPLLFNRVHYFNPTVIALLELSVIAAAAAYGIVRSRRLAGPVQGLIRVMHALDQGDFSARIVQRRGEYFDDALQSFNHSLDRLEKRIIDLQDEVKLVRDTLYTNGQDASHLDRLAIMLEDLQTRHAVKLGHLPKEVRGGEKPYSPTLILEDAS
jgi:methyl-accepting chemotaxis protein